MVIGDKIEKLTTELETKLNDIENDNHQHLLYLSEKIREDADTLIKDKPNIGWKTCVHVIGEARVMKSSYILDLYDNDELRRYLNIIDDAAHEHTACPCMVVPVEAQVDKIKAVKVNISDFDDSKLIKDIEEFQELYALPTEAEKLVEIKGGYFLKIYLPSEDCKFPHMLVEYPGIDSDNYKSDEKTKLYKRMGEEFKLLIDKTPGFVVACFEKKIKVALDHPLVQFVENYRQTFKKVSLTLPLIFSFNGGEAIRTYSSGNSNLIGILDEKFSIHDEFDTKVQLVNPNFQDYPVTWTAIDDRGKTVVNDWINRFSKYERYEKLKTEIEKDGGLAYSRALLTELVKDEELSNSIGYIFHHKWMEKAEETSNKLTEKKEEMDNWEVVEKVIEYLRVRLSDYSNNPYASVKEIFDDNKFDFSQEKPDYKGFWESLISDYYIQFISEELCQDLESAKHNIRNIAKVMFEDVLAYYADSCEIPQPLTFYTDKDMNFALLTIMSFYLPNQILKGDSRLLSAMIGI